MPLPKGKVMFVSNSIKVVGCLMMMFGTHPLLSYAIVGLGAAAYSPAKYGILTELLPPSQLVKANGWIEGLTILSVILGIVLGGQLVGRHVSRFLLGLDLPMIDTGIDTPAEGAIAAIMLLYLVAALFNLYIPRTEAPLQPMSRQLLNLVRDFSQCNARLWNDKLGQISLATTTLFWGIGGNMRVIVFPWAAVALGYNVTQASTLGAVVAIGTAVGAVVAALHMPAGQGHRHHPDGHCDGAADRRAELRHRRLGGGALPDPAGRRQRLPGGADERAAAAPRPQPDGCRPLHRRAELQRAGLHPGPERALRGDDQVRPPPLRRHHRASAWAWR